MSDQSYVERYALRLEAERILVDAMRQPGRVYQADGAWVAPQAWRRAVELIISGLHEEEDR